MRHSTGWFLLQQVVPAKDDEFEASERGLSSRSKLRMLYDEEKTQRGTPNRLSLRAEKPALRWWFKEL